MKNYWVLGGTLDIGTYPRKQEMNFSLSDLDSEERFNTLPPSNWTKDSFTYKYNSYGFRSCEFDLKETNPILLTFGCSHTVGVGVPQYNNWPETFCSTYFPNHVIYNAGLGGASADTVARLAVNMIPIIKPSIVAVLWPSLFRFETYENGAVFNGAWTMEQDNLQYEDNTAYNNQTKNKIILELLQKEYQFKLLSIDWDDTVNNVYTDVAWTKARDGAHYGIDWHQQMAYDFNLQYTTPDDFTLKYTNPKAYWDKYKDKEIK